MHNGCKDLLVWQKAMLLVRLVYKLTDSFPKTEKFILTDQMLRASISIPSNIAEGWSRNRKLELIRYFEMAYGSSAELETQTLISKDRYNQTTECNEITELISEIQKMLSKFISTAKGS